MASGSNKNRVKKAFSNIGDDDLLKAGFLFLIFSVITSLCNYLYQLFMGRMLGPEEYGVLGSLFAIVYIVTFSTNTFNLVISKHVAEFHSKSEAEKIKSIVYKGFKKTLFFGLILLALFILLSPFIGDFMKIDDKAGLIIVGFIGFFSFISVLFTGALNGMQKFFSQNLSGFISTVLKLVLAIGLVFLGFSVNGALAAVLIGIMISLIFSYFPLHKELKTKTSKSFDAKKLYLYAIPVFFATIFYVLIITLDQILVKHYLSSSDAGIYAAAGMIAKMIWFGSGFLIGPLFPKLVSNKANNKSTSKLLRSSLLYVLTLVVIGCIIFFVAPTLIVNVLYGKEYFAAIPLIGMFGVALGIFSLIQILMTYDLAVERYNFIYILLAGLVIEVAGIIVYHNSLLDIVKIVLISNILIIFSMIIYNKEDIFG